MLNSTPGTQVTVTGCYAISRTFSPAQLCKATGYERPRDCIATAISTVESELSSTFRKRPAIAITLDVLRWVATHDSVWPLMLWPAASSLLEEDLARTALRGFPIWLIEYEGQPENERFGHNVHGYSGEFFSEFEQMRLWRLLLPTMAWQSARQVLCCPVPRLRICPQAGAWCSDVFRRPRPRALDRDSCFLGRSFEELCAVSVDRMCWLSGEPGEPTRGTSTQSH